MLPLGYIFMDIRVVGRLVRVAVLEKIQESSDPRDSESWAFQGDLLSESFLARQFDAEERTFREGRLWFLRESHLFVMD